LIKNTLNFIEYSEKVKQEKTSSKDQKIENEKSELYEVDSDQII
jgi:hypothetical protein